ncbi:MAG: homoserine kinase [Campylobacterota bacterium]|nr:homoserine kinase [Campylobacterota bacterium]
MKISVPATSANLGPGFDTLGLALNLRNKVIIKPSKFHSVSLRGEGSRNPALKDNNMFVGIFNDFHKNLTTKRNNYRFEFYNDIPLSRGLGSSSAVIASAIACAYAVENIDIPKQKLLDLALSYEAHPDNITPAIMGGFTTSVVQDNEVKYIKKSLPKDICAVVVIPNRPISTHYSRKTLPTKYTKEESIFNLSHCSVLTAAFMSEKWDMLRVASQDMFHQSYRMKQMPELFAVQKTALRHGALMSTLSGSGSTFLNICMSRDSEKLQEKLSSEFPHFKVLTLGFDNIGVKIEK